MAVPAHRSERNAPVSYTHLDVYKRQIVHRVLTRLFEDRGLALDHTYQLNFGGNMDFKNMLERKRLESKKISKLSLIHI